jgi:arginine/lysine/ornithine decarboxylase
VGIEVESRENATLRLTHGHIVHSTEAIRPIQIVLGGLSQASVINVKGPRVDTTLLKHVFYLFETTSISSLIYGAIDGDRRNMAFHGEEIWGEVLALSRRARRAWTKQNWSLISAGCA